MWEGIRERRYVKSDGERVIDLDGQAIFAEIRDIVQEVAGLHHAGSGNAVLKARTGDIALAVRSAICCIWCTRSPTSIRPRKLQLDRILRAFRTSS